MTFPPPPPSFLLRRSYTINGHTFHTVLVEKGSFVMGDDESEYGDEKPAHTVTLASNFELSEYPVTQALWAAVMGEEWAEKKTRCANKPLEKVSWYNSRDFFRKLNKLYRKNNNFIENPGQFCLPTAAQWEYAARGGQFGRFSHFPFSGSNRMNEIGWYGENSHGETQSVGRKMPNILGLYDMSGNVWEWCEDDGLFGYQKVHKDGSAYVDNPRGSFRTHRGGCYLNSAIFCRVAFNEGDHPDSQDSGLGFRAAFVPRSGG